MTAHPAFPPLMAGRSVADPPFGAAVDAARAGVEAGLILHRITSDDLAAALVLVPEVPVDAAAAMLPLCGVGLQNALGALAPPELAVQLEWGGGIRLNGARAGRLRAAIPPTDGDAVPAWLVVGLDLALARGGDGGEAPDDTTLAAEGCGDVDGERLLEAWARHTLHWIARWEADGIAPLHAEWRGLAHGLGEPVAADGRTGTFLGIDERLGLLLKSADGTALVPLATLLEIR